jgi:hypothetical protein
MPTKSVLRHGSKPAVKVRDQCRHTKRFGVKMNWLKHSGITLLLKRHSRCVKKNSNTCENNLVCLLSVNKL